MESLSVRSKLRNHFPEFLSNPILFQKRELVKQKLDSLDWKLPLPYMEQNKN